PSFARARASSRPTNRATAAPAASLRPALPPSTCRAAARRCALRCRDEFLHFWPPERRDPITTGFNLGRQCQQQSSVTRTVLIMIAAEYGSPRSRGRRVERPMTTMEKTNRPFAHIDTWVFDLNNTLYPHHVNLWHQVDARIGEFVSAWLKISANEARRIQKDYYRRYGTTMSGMMTEHGVHADDYLAYVHQIDHSPLQPN